MRLSADALRRLAALNLAPEAMGEVLSIIADMQDAGKQRSAGAIRQARYRERHQPSPVTSPVTSQERNDVTQKVPTPPFPIKQNNPIPPTSKIVGSGEGDFLIFWAEWPNKVGRPAAIQAFRRATRSHSLETILAGLDRYRRDKPDDRPWLNPATFLNQERFLDAPAGVAARSTGPPPRTRTVSSGMAMVRELLTGYDDAGLDQNRRDGAQSEFSRASPARLF